jgi:hypothetical protein
MDIPGGSPFISALDSVWVRPKDSPRRYLLAPLNYRQRSKLSRDVRFKAGPPLDRAHYLDKIREAVRESNPGNAASLIAEIDAAEEDTERENAKLQARLSLIERAVSNSKAYAALIHAQQNYNDAAAWHQVKAVLRGWEGPGLPSFFRDEAEGMSDELLDAIPAGEFQEISSSANLMLFVGPAALKNSEAPSPAPSTETTSPAA